MKNPWMKFYPTDWRADPRLRMCSREARSLWIDMLCLMHEAEPYGHLVVCGQPLTDTTLAALTGDDASTVSRMRTELETFGVFSRTGTGVIYSRRMTRDHKKAQTARKHGKNGGNPTLCSDGDIQPSVKGSLKGKDKGGVKAQILEARKKEESSAALSERRPKESYWWAMEVIRLDKPDYLAWLALYGGTDDQFMEWLADRDRWFAEKATPQAKANWFHSTIAAIKKLNNRDQT